MTGEFETVAARLRITYARSTRDEREEMLARLWSLVPKFELPEGRDPGPRTTSAAIRCPNCDAPLTVTLSE